MKSYKGVKKLSVHGPPGTKRFVTAGGAFCENRPESDLVPEEIDMAAPAPIVDPYLSIQPIPILPPRETAAARAAAAAPRPACPDALAEGDSEEEGGGADGAANGGENGGENGGKNGGENGGAAQDGGKGGAGEKGGGGGGAARGAGGRRRGGRTRLRLEGGTGPRFVDEEGKMDVAKAKALGVPLGPLLGQLKKGQNVTLPCGKVVRAEECVSPSEAGAVVGIIACPTLRHLPPLLASPLWAAPPPRPVRCPGASKEPPAAGCRSAASAAAAAGAQGASEEGTEEEKIAPALLLHLAPLEVLLDARYSTFVQRLVNARVTGHADAEARRSVVTALRVPSTHEDATISASGTVHLDEVFLDERYSAFEVLLDARYSAFVRGLAPDAKHIVLSAGVCHPQVTHD
ncbi:hypothetical protein T484DRAFT_1820165 [Baffinella frigidus]|nr:hypothetical protein T484DRAFT_1820165 [Cryptophyta sp. CCMP2293]